MADRVRELCELAVKKKIDPDHHASWKAMPKMGKAESAILTAASSGAAPDRAALWVCNGRRIVLKEGGQPLSPRHLRTLELLEAQYDIGEVESEEEEDEAGSAKKKPGSQKKALFEWLGHGEVGRELFMEKSWGEPLQARMHSLVAAIRSEALSHGQNGRFMQPAAIFKHVPAAFRLHLPARQDAASPIKVYGILDPLSTTAQSASAVLALFGMAFNAEVNIVLNPLARHSEYPLKRYYREVIHWPERLADGTASAELEAGQVGAGRAEFTLATEHTLTAAVHALPTWLVTAYEAEHDMDNLRLADIGGSSCEAKYVLRQLYVEGQAFILSEDGWPTAIPKGLQLELHASGAEGAEAVEDTIVMGNFGYFQVHGNPGLYQVTLKHGLSNDTFVPVSMHDVEVSSYITPAYQLRVKLRPGRSHEDLFEQESPKKLDAPADRRDDSGSSFSRLMGSITSVFSGSGAQPDQGIELEVASSKDTAGLPTIHIFSVASGHLYEKLLGIMILSVRNTTKCPLHFWFIDNFLSPKFKLFIPQLARRYDFDFDFVTYKWPSWLNPQSEKQRLIWAYKVLFLDVLFPLDVPKVIFIDADQVVRADVRELWDMDLQGRVYGFVPMGDTNPDTEGFRFWKQGYWKSHLGSLQYHISALYVVDLVEFRRTSIGDQLRATYNQLSRDPNSLSNLEQDLINFAQHQVPILSLPAEWLWCETWCSQETKVRAKTIDLCQNPLTKEPKIVMASRIISEWQTYHDEVQRVQDGLEGSLPTDRLSQPGVVKAEL